LEKKEKTREGEREDTHQMVTNKQQINKKQQEILPLRETTKQKYSLNRRGRKQQICLSRKERV